MTRRIELENTKLHVRCATKNFSTKNLDSKAQKNCPCYLGLFFFYLILCFRNQNRYLVCNLFVVFVRVLKHYYNLNLNIFGKNLSNELSAGATAGQQLKKKYPKVFLPKKIEFRGIPWRSPQNSFRIPCEFCGIPQMM